MNATRLLKQDHEKVKGLFREYEQAGERAHKQKQRIVEQVFQELQIHTTLEEEIFYPAVRQAAEEIVAESLQEHHVVDVLMKEMERLQPDNPEYDAKFQVLMENVKHHAEEEEQEMFPVAERQLAADLDRLGEQMQRRKEEMVSRAR